MEQKGDRIIISGLDESMDSQLQAPAVQTPVTYHFSQNEDFFIRLPEEIQIPSFPIHHDVRIHHPLDNERESILASLRQLLPAIGPFISGTRFFFDPTENQKPSFIQILKCEDQLYAYIVRIDLAFRASHSRMIERGDNDFSGTYRSRNFFIETDILPMQELKTIEKNTLELKLIQHISETWIGETGRGYFVQGIWLDREITKFFTRLALPQGKRVYPWFPLNCRYRSICYQAIDLSPEGRKKGLQILHTLRKFLIPNITAVEKSLHKQDFSEDIETFMKLKALVGGRFDEYFRNCTIKSYLNQDEMKEYEITF